MRRVYLFLGTVRDMALDENGSTAPVEIVDALPSIQAIAAFNVTWITTGGSAIGAVTYSNNISRLGERGRHHDTMRMHLLVTVDEIEAGKNI